MSLDAAPRGVLLLLATLDALVGVGCAVFTFYILLAFSRSSKVDCDTGRWVLLGLGFASLASLGVAWLTRRGHPWRWWLQVVPLGVLFWIRFLLGPAQ